MRLLLLASLVSTQIIGCVPRSKAGGTIATVTGAAMAVVGTAMLVELKSPGNDTNGNGRDDFPENDIACAIGGCAIALALIAAGVVVGGSGLIALTDPDEPARPPVVVAAAAPPPAAAPIDIRLIAPLPEVATDDQTLRMAQQARGAARRGDCEAAYVTLEHIRERDPRYAHALAGSVALAPCR